MIYTTLKSSTWRHNIKQCYQSSLASTRSEIRIIQLFHRWQWRSNTSINGIIHVILTSKTLWSVLYYDVTEPSDHDVTRIYIWRHASLLRRCSSWFVSTVSDDNLYSSGNLVASTGSFWFVARTWKSLDVEFNF